MAGKPIHSSGTFDLGGMSIFRLGFGAMRITGPGIWGPPRDESEAIDVLRKAVEFGVNFIDTADSYGPTISEELIAKALLPYGDVLIGTKAGLTRTGPNVWPPVGRPEYLRQQCELSLRRLGVDSLDLFQLHRIDPKVPADEQFGLLKELLDEGKVKTVGLSEVNVAEIQAAEKIVKISTVQNLYNLSNRQSEDVLTYCEGQGIGFIPWAPVASGGLTKPGGPLDQIAHEVEATITQVAIAWLLKRSEVMIPIPGTSRVAHVEENCAAAEVVLSDAQFAALSNGEE